MKICAPRISSTDSVERWSNSLSFPRWNKNITAERGQQQTNWGITKTLQKERAAVSLLMQTNAHAKMFPLPPHCRAPHLSLTAPVWTGSEVCRSRAPSMSGVTVTISRLMTNNPEPPLLLPLIPKSILSVISWPLDPRAGDPPLTNVL